MKILVFINVFLIIANIVFFSKADFLGRILKLIDKPDNVRKIHKIAVPVLGGISLVFTISVNLFIFYMLELISLKIFLTYFIPIFSFFLIGLVDDYKNINPKIKLSFSVIFLGIFFLFFYEYVIFDLSFSSFDKIISIGVISIPFTILCFMLLQNAINMIDGLNGL